ncbi:hypothetical protein SEA_MAKAI_23 [Arthrobacter phage Makai]|nr:hypothetical protein SEA_MAKAI_23 [Arthrobacter phage Makai]
MAIITGITAEKMQEYVDENIVSGSINEMGNLILVKRDGTQVDAGSSVPVVPLASDIEPGRIQLATNAEAIAGTATDRAITPWNLANLVGYRFWQTIKYTSSGTFQKATYPGAKMIRVRVQAGGGSGGCAATASTGNNSKGAGGGGGGYAERILYMENLAASETVTVGAGGASTTTVGAGNTGGTSSFGTLCVATGGIGGQTATNQSLMVNAVGGEGGIGTTGDILIKGGAGGPGIGYATLGTGGTGGNSVMGGGADGTATPSGGGNQNGRTGGNYGGGGGGAMANAGFSGTAPSGAGAPGIVLVDVYL